MAELSSLIVCLLIILITIFIFKLCFQIFIDIVKLFVEFVKWIFTSWENVLIIFLVILVLSKL